jgi:hypothetical protein
MTSTETIAELEGKLNNFAPRERTAALAELTTRARTAELGLPAERAIANMHCHTFFSFNAYGLSPTGVAWTGRKNGIPLMGIVDFDVLDGVDEFLQACLIAGVRGSAAMETRAFFPEFATREINSPGEPGVYYYMGIGFTQSQVPWQAAEILNGLRKRAEARNRAMVERINGYLDPVRVDYNQDVIPLTPAGNATERHLLAAYTRAAEKQFSDPAPFWAEKLKLSEEQVRAQIGNTPTFHNTVRGKLMKRGGVGYAQPEAGSFPSIDEVNQLILACGALPCATWLDGLSEGEQAEEELLRVQIAKGAAALNIVPDRNWNIADPEMRKVKLQKLYEVVALAQRLDLPLNIGTEMNAHGQKLVDDFDAPELAPVREAFLDGAYFVYGHTMMQMASGMGYQSEWAKANLPTRKERNAFYTQVGRTTPPGPAGLEMLRKPGMNAHPGEFLIKE